MKNSLRKIFPKLSEEKISSKAKALNIMVDRVQSKNDQFLGLETRNGDVEVSLESATFLATSDFVSWQKENFVSKTVGRNVTGHYLPASSTYC